MARLDWYEDGCDFYQANPDYCKEAYMYANADGVDAKDACCVCQGIDDSIVDVGDAGQLCSLVFPDADYDGCMSESEYVSSLENATDSATLPSFEVIDDVWGYDSCISEGDFEVECLLTSHFMSMDANANGCLSYEEVLTATSESGGDEVSKEEFDSVATLTPSTGSCDGVSYHDFFVVSADDFTDASSDCTEDSEWVDSMGDGCAAYAANPGWCYDARAYADENGIDASTTCCSCLYIDIPYEDEYGACTDLPGASGQVWFDGTNGCAEYAANDFCPLYGHVDYNGEGSANERCCVCGGGSVGYETDVYDDPVCEFESTDYGICDSSVSEAKWSWLGDTSEYPNAMACLEGCLQRYRAPPVSCTWVENNINTYGERYAGEVESEEECIALVRKQCPTATIANLDTSVGSDSNVKGSCWCQWGSDLTLVPGSGWKNCLLTPYKWDDGYTCFLNDSFVPSALMFAEWWSEGEGYECHDSWCPELNTGCGCWCTWECDTPDRQWADDLARNGSVGDMVGVSEAACNIMYTSDSPNCTYMSYPCSDIASGGWGADAAIVCDPAAGAWYVCDQSGKHASIACAKTCGEVWQSSYMWDETGTDSCVYAFDGMCDEPSGLCDDAGSGWCDAGTDTYDCYDYCQDVHATDSVSSDCDFSIFDSDMNGCMSQEEYYMNVDPADPSYPDFDVINDVWGLDSCVSAEDFYNGCFLTMFFREHDANGDGCWSYSEFYAANVAQGETFLTFDDYDADDDECIRYEEVDSYGVSSKEFEMYDSNEQDGCVTREEYGASHTHYFHSMAGDDDCLSYADMFILVSDSWTGEDACQGWGYSESECLAVGISASEGQGGCCQWDPSTEPSSHGWPPAPNDSDPPYLAYLLSAGWPAACCGGTFQGSIANLRGVDGSNFCQNTADLVDMAHPPASSGLGGGSSTTCSSLSETLLFSVLNATSWDEVSCEQVSNTMMSSTTPLRQFLSPSCCGGQATVTTAVATGNKIIESAASRSIEITACPSSLDTEGRPNGEEACEYQGFTTQGECEKVGCCSWDSGAAMCWSDVGQAQCIGGQECGCTDDQWFDPWADGSSGGCRTPCDYETEDEVAGKCVTRCADGALKLISAGPTVPSSESEPTATVATPLGVPSITECPGTPGTDSDACGCDYQVHGDQIEVGCDDTIAGCTNGRVYKCFKCPDGEMLSYENSPRCYAQDVDVHWQVIQCDDNGDLENAVATGAVPTDQRTVSDCPNSGATEWSQCGCTGDKFPDYVDGQLKCIECPAPQRRNDDSACYSCPPGEDPFLYRLPVVHVDLRVIIVEVALHGQ